MLVTRCSRSPRTQHCGLNKPISKTKRSNYVLFIYPDDCRLRFERCRQLPLQTDMSLSDQINAVDARALKIANRMLTQSWDNFKVGKIGTDNDSVDVWTPFSLDHVCGHLLPGAVIVDEVQPLIKAPALTQVKQVPIKSIKSGVFIQTAFTDYCAIVAKRQYYLELKARRVAGADAQLAMLASQIANIRPNMSAMPTGMLWSDGTGTFFKTVQGGVLTHVGSSVPTPAAHVAALVDFLMAGMDVTPPEGMSEAAYRASLRTEFISEFGISFGTSINIGTLAPSRLPPADLEVLERDAALVVGSPAFIVDVIGTVMEETTVAGVTDIVRDAALALSKRVGVTTVALKSLPRSISDFLSDYGNVRDFPFLRSVEAFYNQKGGFDVITADADFYGSQRAQELTRVHPALLSYVSFAPANDGLTAVVTYSVRMPSGDRSTRRRP
ncbi:hypothetical protein ER16_Medium3 [Pseudomonas phage ER16]|nr:hypothetical protein ER16_Medium3 [Pseudomonas phage ER16]